MTKDEIKAKLMEKTAIDPVLGCWLYQGKPRDSHSRHCRVFFNGRLEYVHRISAHIHWGYDLRNSDILILHSVACSTPNCWNPEHLKEGTREDNVRDSIIDETYRNPIAERESQKTHCPKGHPLDGLRGNGKRYCKTCNRMRAGYV